jgi:hypothetical protein
MATRAAKEWRTYQLAMKVVILIALTISVVIGTVNYVVFVSWLSAVM